MSSLPAVSDAGPRLQVLPQEGRGFLFFVVMFGLTVLIAVRSLLMGSEVAAPTAFLLIGVSGLVAVHRFRRLSLRAVAVHERGLVLVRGAGEEVLPWADVRDVRRDVGPDAQLAYLVRLPGDRLLRLRLPQRGADAALQSFVEALAAQGGLSWSEGRAQRAA